MNVTLSQLSNQIENALGELKGKRDRVEIVSLIGINAEYKERLFENGQATDGSKIGKYVSDWKKDRQRRGRQVAFVDQNDQGDNQRSVQVGKASRKNVIGFINDKERLKAQGAEDYRKKKIYTVSDREIDYGIKQGTAEVLKIFKNGFNKV